MVSTKSKKGSYIMEAAIVLPVIIFAVITSVLIIMFFYSQMTERSKMHIVLRQEAGAMTEHTESFQKAKWEGEYYWEKAAVGGVVYGEKRLTMDHYGLLLKNDGFRIEGSCYAVDGTKYVRYCNLVKGVTGNE